MPTVTIFTPTYNRASFLPTIFKGLLEQDSLDFEWVVVDDGSTDETVEVMQRLKENSPFPVVYYQKKNGGKHTAINEGVRLANGELFLILDSDDELPNTAINDILLEYNKIKDDKSIGGICGYMAHRDGTPIGQPLISVIANSLELRYKYHVTGDMAEIFRVDVLRQFPFPETAGERFCPEVLVWNRIAQHYRLHIFPKVIYYRDYLQGGLTDNIVRVRRNSPINTCTTYAEMCQLSIPFFAKCRAAINYWRFRPFLFLRDIPFLSVIWWGLIPVGLMLRCMDELRK